MTPIWLGLPKPLVRPSASELIRFATLLEMDRIAENLKTAPRAFPISFARSRNIPTWIQGSMQEVDIQHSIENTLTIMHHKLKRGITVTRDYAPGLPKVMASGSELNQVWTNLIDNAADAMNGAGKLGIRVALENDFILVEIADSGPGIPAEVKSRIFDPFSLPRVLGRAPALASMSSTALSKMSAARSA